MPWLDCTRTVQNTVSALFPCHPIIVRPSSAAFPDPRSQLLTKSSQLLCRPPTIVLRRPLRLHKNPVWDTDNDQPPSHDRRWQVPRRARPAGDPPRHQRRRRSQVPQQSRSAVTRAQRFLRWRPRQLRRQALSKGRCAPPLLPLETMRLQHHPLCLHLGGHRGSWPGDLRRGMDRRDHRGAEGGKGLRILYLHGSPSGCCACLEPLFFRLVFLSHSS